MIVSMSSLLFILLLFPGSRHRSVAFTVDRPSLHGGQLFAVSARTTPSTHDITSDNPDVSGGVGRRVVIVGGGIGGVATAYDARHLLGKKDKIVLVSDQPQFSFTPSNPWVAIRKRTPSDIQLPLAAILPRHGVEFVHDKAVGLKPGSNCLQLASGNSLSYDYLVIATGPRLAFDHIPGLKEASASVCTTPHALHAAKLVDKLVEQPGPVVVGAAQGASCFGPAYEFALLLRYELLKRGGAKLADACPMTFVTPEPEVGHLGLDGAGNSKQIMKSLLETNNIDCLTNTRTVKATKTSVSVEQLDANGKVVNKKVLPSKLTMIIPAFEGHKVWKSVPGLTDSKGLIIVNEFQQSPAFSNIFAVGVAVSIPQILKTVLPCGVPKTGYLIESQGTAAVKNIRTLMDWNRSGASMKDIGGAPSLHSRSLLNALCITDFGNDGAIFLTMPQVPPRRRDWTIHSKLATLAKIAFEKYFLHKVESGDTDPYYEKYMLKLIGVERTKDDVDLKETVTKSPSQG
jgi:NADH dehydrogenase FAD-containing subunit